MKSVLLILSLMAFSSCRETNGTAEQRRTSEVVAYQALKETEARTEQFIRDYMADLNTSDWNAKLPKYLQPDSDAFLREHAAFRTSFPNYKATIKHLAIDGNRCIAWINIHANYAKTYDFEGPDNAYRDGLLKGIPAENQRLSWDETWYFDVVDGKFGPEWDFLKDNYAVLAGLREVP